jgi:diguanylate cyclase (GGDEF)-like protein
MFVLPVTWLLYLIWDLDRTARAAGVSSASVSVGVMISIPAVVLLSLGAFILIYRSVKSVEKTAGAAAAFAKELHIEDHKTITQADEAEKLSFFVNNMIGELRQKLTDVDHYAQELHNANRQLVEIAVNDGLTGLYNHKHIQHVLTTELERARKFGHPLSVLMMDVDDFKKYNDTYGHPRGDEALKTMAEIVKANTRRVDISARYGGEEFLVVVPEGNAAEATKIAERIRRAIAEHAFGGTKPGETTRLTMSIGVGSYTEEQTAATELVAVADKNLYAAKKAGKNCVCP